MPDRYSDAVRARRAELRAQHAQLTGGHRAELRTGLALARLTASAELSAALGDLGREARVHIEQSDRPGREELPAALARAVLALRAWLHGRWDCTVRPAVRRVATGRSVPVQLGWPPVPPAQGAVILPPPEPTPGALRAVLGGAAEGMGAWRLALLPAAGLPLVGMPAVGGPAALPLAAGTSLAVAFAMARVRLAAADRARLRRWSDEALAAVRAAFEAELGRLLIEIERSAGTDLDVAVTRRRAAVEAELRALGSASEGRTGATV